MALPEAELFGLQDLVTLVLRGDAPHLVHVLGAESLRAAAVMAHLLDLKRTTNADKEDSVMENGDKEVIIANADKEEMGNGDKEREDADQESGFGDLGGDVEEDGHGNTNGWIIPNMKVLQHFAHVDGLLHKLYLDIIPKLKIHPGDDGTLRSLDAIAKDLRRAGNLVPGDAGKMTVKLGNKMRKLVSHAFNKRGKWSDRKEGGKGNRKAGKMSKVKAKVGVKAFKAGGSKAEAQHPKVARTAVSRAQFIARRLKNLVNQVEKVHDQCPVVIM